VITISYLCFAFTYLTLFNVKKNEKLKTTSGSFLMFTIFMRGMWKFGINNPTQSSFVVADYALFVRNFFFVNV